MGVIVKHPSWTLPMKKKAAGATKSFLRLPPSGMLKETHEFKMEVQPDQSKDTFLLRFSLNVCPEPQILPCEPLPASWRSILWGW